MPNNWPYRANPFCRHICRAMGAVLQVSTMRGSIRDEHKAIAQASAEGDADTAEALTRQHGIEAGRSLASLLSTALDRPLLAS